MAATLDRRRIVNHTVAGVVLRRPEPSDVEALYQQKNDPEVARLLGGFSTGYAREDVRQWMVFHRTRTDEVIRVIAAREDDRCLGHVGLYRIDHRIRSAEFGIMIGDAATRGRGVGKACARFAVEYGFRELNLNRVSAEVLAGNTRVIRLYEGVGFRIEGRLRQAQYKGGEYLDVVLMGILRDELLADGAAQARQP